MTPEQRWPQLRQLLHCATSIGNLDVWLFGSATQLERPNDIDVLIIYDSAEAVARLRKSHDWASREPPIEIIAMTADEEVEYQFTIGTAAKLLARGR